MNERTKRLLERIAHSDDPSVSAHERLRAFELLAEAAKREPPSWSEPPSDEELQDVSWTRCYRAGSPRYSGRNGRNAKTFSAD